MSDYGHERRCQNQGTDRSSRGFVWTRVWNKFLAPKQMTTDVGKDIVEPHGEDDQQKHWPIIPIVCHVAKVTERASEKSEPQDTQAYALDVSFWLIKNQSADGNQRDSQRK
jgi:hypothetical protein